MIIIIIEKDYIKEGRKEGRRGEREKKIKREKKGGIII